MSAEFVDAVRDTYDKARVLLLRKHADYGPDNIARAPGGALNGLRVRMHDKLARINHLIDSGVTPENESLRDSFIDLLNYGAIGLLVLDGHWPTAVSSMPLPNTFECGTPGCLVNHQVGPDEDGGPFDSVFIEGGATLPYSTAADYTWNGRAFIPDAVAQTIWAAGTPERATELLEEFLAERVVMHDKQPCVWYTDYCRLTKVCSELTEAKEKAEAKVKALVDTLETVKADRACTNGALEIVKARVARRDEIIRDGNQSLSNANEQIRDLTHQLAGTKAASDVFEKTMKRAGEEIKQLQQDLATVQQTRDQYKQQRNAAEEGWKNTGVNRDELRKALKGALGYLSPETIPHGYEWVKLVED